MPIHMRIMSDNQLVADCPDWNAPVPRVGEYIYHPEQLGTPQTYHYLSGVAGHVKVVTWQTHIRVEKDGRTQFVQNPDPYVEIVI